MPESIFELRVPEPEVRGQEATRNCSRRRQNHLSGHSANGETGGRVGNRDEGRSPEDVPESSGEFAMSNWVGCGDVEWPG